MRAKTALLGTIALSALALTVPAAMATPSAGEQGTLLSRTTASTLGAVSQPGTSFGRARGHELRPILGFAQPTAPQLGLLTLPVDIVLISITYQPGGISGWHSHPGVVLVKVISGTLTEYRSEDPACGAIKHAAGETFVEGELTGAVRAGLVRNEGSVPATIQVTAFIPVGAAARIDQPQPPNCPMF